MIVNDMAVVGEELYVVDASALCLRVFSFAGAHLRDVRGAWRQPRHLCHFDGRLYLAEMGGVRDMVMAMDCSTHLG